MSLDRIPPAWRLPEGVNASLWEYTHTARLAEEEDAYFRDHPLFATDARVVDAHFTEPRRSLTSAAAPAGMRFASPGGGFPSWRWSSRRQCSFA